MTYILAVEGSEYYDLENQRTDFRHKIEISQDVLDWLDAHDVEMVPDGSKVYICNKLRYRFIGPKIYLEQFKTDGDEATTGDNIRYQQPAGSGNRTDI